MSTSGQHESRGHGTAQHFTLTNPVPGRSHCAEPSGNMR
jgi:hypothetical protein